MKKAILIIALVVGLMVIAAAIFIYPYIRQIELGKSFCIVIDEDEVVDYNAVDQDQMCGRVHRMWFDMIRETERDELVRYMKENNYIIAPGCYHLRQGYKFDDLLKELKFKVITQKEKSDRTELGKSFYIRIKEDEVIDYYAVDQDQYINGIPLIWFDGIGETEREKLVSYMKENNYKIVPGRYHLRQGYKFDDLLKELKFEVITQTEESDREV